MHSVARTFEERKRETLVRLEENINAWVATAGEEPGRPYLVPLSYLWDGETLLISTPAASPTGRNLQSSGTVRLGIGPTSDVVLIEGTVLTLAIEDISREVGDAFAVKSGFNPRELATPYLYFRIIPTRIQAWRGPDELSGRDLMRDGLWLASD